MGLRQKAFYIATKRKRFTKIIRKSTAFDFNAIVWGKLLGPVP